MRIALLGTRGVPPRYGGFETAADEIGARLAARGHRVVVYCRNPGQRLRTHRGMELVNLPAIRSKSLETLSHTALSTIHAAIRSRPDVVVLFNPANAPFVPMLKAAGITTIVHFDGLDAERAKWGRLGRAYYRSAERMSVRLADDVIANSMAISASIRASMVACRRTSPTEHRSCRPDRIGSPPSGSSRAGSTSSSPGSNRRTTSTWWSKAIAGRDPPCRSSSSGRPRMRRRIGRAWPASAGPDVRFLGAVWDQELLDQLYGHCASYLHGHSVGGTNPSLLRAMGAGAPIVAYDVAFNRETAGTAAGYFVDARGVAALIAADESDPVGAMARGDEGRRRAARRYVWDDVAGEYERLCQRLIEHGP